MRVYRTVWLDPYDLVVRFRYFHTKRDMSRFVGKVTTDREFPVRRNQIQTERLDQTTGNWTTL
jgi:hypothetical protein